MIAGITEKEQKIIERILDKYRKDYVFFYYGSRVKGTYEKTSDLDILVKGKAEMPSAVLQGIKEEFDNSDLPYIVNFSDYYKLDGSFYKRIKPDLIPYNWQEVKLGDVCIKITDGAHWSPKTQENGFPMASVKDMDEYGFNLSLCRKISKEDFDQLVVNDCKPIYNDVLIAKDGSFLKQVFEIKKEIDVVILSSIAIVRPNIEKIYPSFLKYIFLNPLFKEIVANHYVSGAVIPRIILKDFKQIPIPLPPLDVQKKIAGVLGALDDKIELNNKINQNLEAQAQALFKSLYNMENNGTLNDIIDTVETGNRPKGGARSYGIPSIGAENIEKFGVYDYSKEKFIDKDFYESMKRGKVKSGDVLLYKDGAYTGKVSLALDGFPHKTCAVNEHVFIIRGNPQISSQFFIYFCLSNEVNRNYLHTLASSKAAQPGLNQFELLSLPIFIPPIDLLKNFTNDVSPVMHKIAANALENFRLAELRDTLLPKLMNGEIDVDNVKID